ncbi:MAG: hypothetical protein QW292_12885 [Candidatus Parvarchaeota archaeon]
MENENIAPRMFFVRINPRTFIAEGIRAMGVRLGSTDIATLMVMAVNWF